MRELEIVIVFDFVFVVVDGVIILRLFCYEGHALKLEA